MTIRNIREEREIRAHINAKTARINSINSRATAIALFVREVKAGTQDASPEILLGLKAELDELHSELKAEKKWIAEAKQAIANFYRPASAPELTYA